MSCPELDRVARYFIERMNNKEVNGYSSIDRVHCKVLVRDIEWDSSSKKLSRTLISVPPVNVKSIEAIFFAHAVTVLADCPICSIDEIDAFIELIRPTSSDS